MSEVGFIAQRQEDITEELAHRRATDVVRSRCVAIIKDFGEINREQSDDPFFDLPAVKWSDDGRELVKLVLRNHENEDIFQDEVAERPPGTAFGLVSTVDVLFFPREDEVNKGGLITVARIELWSGSENSSKIYDYNGIRLSKEDVEALDTDLQRYRQLIIEGRIELPPNIEFQPIPVV